MISFEFLSNEWGLHTRVLYRNQQQQQNKMKFEKNWMRWKQNSEIKTQSVHHGTHHHFIQIIIIHIVLHIMIMIIIIHCS